MNIKIIVVLLLVSFISHAEDHRSIPDFKQYVMFKFYRDISTKAWKKEVKKIGILIGEIQVLEDAQKCKLILKDKEISCELGGDQGDLALISKKDVVDVFNQKYKGKPLTVESNWEHFEIEAWQNSQEDYIIHRDLRVNARVATSRIINMR